MHDKVNHFDYYNIYLFSMIKIDDMVQTLGYTREVDYHWIEDGKWVTLEKDVQLMFILNRLTESVFTIYVQSDESIQLSDFSDDGYGDNDDDLFKQNVDNEVE